MAPTPTRSIIRLAAAASVILILAAACTTGGGATSGSSAGASPAPAASPGAAASASSGGGRYGGGTDDEYSRTPAPSAASEASDDAGGQTHEVNVGNSDHGAYLTGDDGLALYVFGNDSANTSACNGGCATTWPPFTIADGDELKPGAGVKGKLTTFARADGSMQVAYDRSPLYYYSADEAAGDTKGQGIGDVWFIAKP